jgi:hypothetical protein
VSGHSRTPKFYRDLNKIGIRRFILAGANKMKAEEDGMIDGSTRATVKKVLFLCTGNYYRSRFAEELFNHHAEHAGLAWIAESRGLALERGVHNIGTISSFALRTQLALVPPGHASFDAHKLVFGSARRTRKRRCLIHCVAPLRTRFNRKTPRCLRWFGRFPAASEGQECVIA